MRSSSAASAQLLEPRDLCLRERLEPRHRPARAHATAPTRRRAVRRAAAGSPSTRAACASSTSVSKRRASIASASTASRYPDATVSSAEPAAPSERRSRDTVTCRLRIASAGAARGHSASAADSADTGCGARTANNVNNARCLPAGTPTTSPSTRGSTEPRIAISQRHRTANTTPAHTPCERHATAVQPRPATVQSVQATTPARRPPCRSTPPPSSPPGSPASRAIAASPPPASTAGAATVVIADDQPAPGPHDRRAEPAGHPLLRHRSQQGRQHARTRPSRPCSSRVASRTRTSRPTRPAPHRAVRAPVVGFRPITVLDIDAIREARADRFRSRAPSLRRPLRRFPRWKRKHSRPPAVQDDRARSSRAR